MAGRNQVDARDANDAHNAVPPAVTSQSPQNPQSPQPLRSVTAGVTADVNVDVTVGAFAAGVRHRARRVLDGEGAKGNRLTLILATVVLLTAAMGVYLISVGLYMVGYLALGAKPWLDIAAYALMGVLALTVVLPLAAAVFRLACLMTCRMAAGTFGFPEGLTATSVATELALIVYPFTSRRAYGRCMAVGLETLGWTLLWAGLPAAGFGVLASLFDRMAESGVSAGLCDLMTGLSLLLCVGLGVLFLFLSGWRAGFGYFVFAHEDMTLGEVNRRFKGCRRSFARPFILRLSLTGWVALSIVAVLVPFVLHTVPYGLCCGAVYGGMLNAE